jgi:hypothetical protein
MPQFLENANSPASLDLRLRRRGRKDEFLEFSKNRRETPVGNLLE